MCPVIGAVPEPLGEHQKPLGAAGKYILPVTLADFLFYISITLGAVANSQ